MTSGPQRSEPIDAHQLLARRDFAMLDGRVYSLTGLSEIYDMLRLPMDWEEPERGIPLSKEIWTAIDERASR